MYINSLERFEYAQKRDYSNALEEIKRGKKCSHWMWYIFPQLRGLGQSDMSHYYGVIDLDEAKKYLQNPILSQRLYEICRELLKHGDKSAKEILGGIDAKKLKSSMTLFEAAAEDNLVFRQVLDCFFEGERDGKTLELLKLR